MRNLAIQVKRRFEGYQIIVREQCAGVGEFSRLGEMLPTNNFTFLSVHDIQLVHLGVLAERYFRDDPVTAIFMLRQFAEPLRQRIAASNALYEGNQALEETLRRLSYERIIPREVADLFYATYVLGRSST